MMEPAGRHNPPSPQLLLPHCHHHTGDKLVCRAASYLCGREDFPGCMRAMMFETRVKVGPIDLLIAQSGFALSNRDLSIYPERLLLTSHRKCVLILSQCLFIGGRLRFYSRLIS